STRTWIFRAYPGLPPEDPDEPTEEFINSPIGFTAAYNVATTNVDLSWTAPTTGNGGTAPDHYEIGRYSSGTGLVTVESSLAAGSPGSAETYEDVDTFTAGQTYYYYIIAYTAAGVRSQT